jgi:hypothetical protein
MAEAHVRRKAARRRVVEVAGRPIDRGLRSPSSLRADHAGQSMTAEALVAGEM